MIIFDCLHSFYNHCFFIFLQKDPNTSQKMRAAVCAVLLMLTLCPGTCVFILFIYNTSQEMHTDEMI